MTIRISFSDNTVRVAVELNGGIESLTTELPQRPWVGLTDEELIACAVHARFKFDPPYVDKDGTKHLAHYEIQLGPTYKNIEAKLKEKNT